MSYIRRKRVHGRVKEGKRDYFYYYRVETMREGGKVRQVVRDYLGTAEQAIAKLEASDAAEQEKSKLRARLEEMITDEAGAHQNARIA